MQYPASSQSEASPKTEDRRTFLTRRRFVEAAHICRYATVLEETGRILTPHQITEPTLNHAQDPVQRDQTKSKE